MRQAHGGRKTSLNRGRFARLPTKMRDPEATTPVFVAISELVTRRHAAFVHRSNDRSSTAAAVEVCVPSRERSG
jgi:hypothetical protein